MNIEYFLLAFKQTLHNRNTYTIQLGKANVDINLIKILTFSFMLKITI